MQGKNIPPSVADNAKDALAAVYELTKILRSQTGCPWDKEQTPQSMRTNLLEEAYEAVDAMTNDDKAHVKEELGDVLFNTILMAYMYEQDGAFSVADVCNEIVQKLVRRHPHVFVCSDGVSEQRGNVKTGEAVIDQWDRIKEKVEKRERSNILDEVPSSYPPLLKARKYMDKASKKGFDWPSVAEALDKMEEEKKEVLEAIKDVENKLKETSCAKKKALTVSGSSPETDVAQLHLEEELGDLLFAVVNVCRKVNVDPAIALDRTNRKFYNRFCYVEDKMKENGISMDSEHTAEMLKTWNEAKKNNKKKC